ncbi:hypothetical protein N825_00905 [Skermanella stibiiresistens SB22]|jgi:hypothetical protein|uniref:Uncharacterized protein n=1 Tax=Skermanella stibiiresistens SB22 TaxID=1385369 RepID=W9HFY2_9PROT|nr:hypothetical protein [Skermanella stibiiresistens]EWY42813.1 hypothetical protein N825_00905 [Skermanella stibiiresistens SB22]
MVADLTEHLPGRHVEPGDQGLGAMTDILELPPFNGARTQGQARRTAFQNLMLVISSSETVRTPAIAAVLAAW